MSLKSISTVGVRIQQQRRAEQEAERASSDSIINWPSRELGQIEEEFVKSSSRQVFKSSSRQVVKSSSLFKSRNETFMKRTKGMGL
jgi:hypothetical protein